MSHHTPKTKKFNNIKAVIFDWSGVISDDRRPVHTADGIVLNKYGVTNLSFEDWLKDTKASAPEYFAYLGVQGDPITLLKEYTQALHQVRDQGIHPEIYPGAALTLVELRKKYKLFVVSKHPHEHLICEAQEYEIEELFSEIDGDIPEKSLAIKNILASYEFKPNQVVYVGDMIFDIQAAKRAGVISVGVSTGYQVKEVLKKENPDILIESLTELLDYV